MTAADPVGLELVAIALMAAAAFLIRAGGFWLMGRVCLTARVQRMLGALPGSIVVAVVLPIVVRTGSAALLAVGAAVLVTIACRSTLLGVAAGVAAAALARSAGL